MIDSGRRCCVCKRYKGVGVEIHHIIPKAKGGENTYENGIVLCFDCHCAAGHYNSDHPRGTKFSPQELRGHKKQWFEFINKNKDQIGEEADDHKIVCRYYVTSDREAARKFLESDDDSLIKTKYLLNTPSLFKQFNQLKSEYPDGVQDDDVDGWGDNYYETKEALLLDYPEFIDSEIVRVNQRLLDMGVLKDPFGLRLLQAGAISKEVASINCFEDGCGGSGWGIDCQTRKAYFVFAQIINLDEETIRVTSLNNQPFELNKFTESDIFEMSDTQNIYKINNLELSAHESISLFLGVIAGPINSDPSSYQFETGPEISENYEGDTLERLSFNSEGSSSDFSTCGNLYILKTLSFFKKDKELEVAFEDFQPDTLFILTREWLCGSCPHLFGICKTTGSIHFIQTLFDNSLGENISENINCKEYSKLIIAEFDNEISEITSVCMNDADVLLGKQLHYGDSIELDVQYLESIGISGFYNAKIQSPKNSAQRRQKFSKYQAYEKELRSGFLSSESLIL